MFITLTDCDNGQVCYIRPEAIVAIMMLSPTMTEVVLAGAESFAVRESPTKVRQLVEAAER